MAETAPKYLFKVITFENWDASRGKETIKLTAEDDSFINLSRDDQLDKITEKYWAKVPKYVILKIESSQLPGRLVFEVNPGGVNKYYHLYEGSIPLKAVVEFRVIEKNIPSSVSGALKIVLAGEQVLRTQAHSLSKEEILSKEIQYLIAEMQTAMRAAPGVGLAAPQIGQSLQLIVIEDKKEYHSFLTPQQLAERGRVPVPFHVVINPVLLIEEMDQAEFFEGCLSVPVLFGVVPRAKSVRVECLNEKAEPVVIKAQGWYARILQHEIDHLRGTLFLDRVKTRTLMTQENFAKLWKSKPVNEVQHALNSP